jgi:hypothetical protein
MDFETYRQDVFRTVRPDTPERERLLIAALGLCGESGEVAENVKKALFQGHALETSALSWVMCSGTSSSSATPSA